jgi:hypothetical protein
MPRLLLVFTLVAAVPAPGGRLGDARDTPVMLRWAALLGAMLVLVLWVLS